MHLFKNNYYIMRHGQSKANVAGLIVSSPTIGCEQYGLTEVGQQQIVDSVNGFSETKPTKIICSDFLRTRETALLTAQHFKLSDTCIITDIALRERFFGDLDGKSDDFYESAWENDAKQQEAGNVEPVDKVLARGLELLVRLEQSYQNETLLLVSHGDMLQILKTAFSGVPAHQHRGLPHHHTAEIKQLATIGSVMPQG